MTINDTSLFIFVVIFFFTVPILISSIGETFTEVEPIDTAEVISIDYDQYNITIGNYCAFDINYNFFNDDELIKRCESTPGNFSTDCADYLDADYTGDCVATIDSYYNEEGLIDKLNSFFTKFGNGISVLPTSVNVIIFGIYTMAVLYLIAKLIRGF